MIVCDTSAIVAILRGELDAEQHKKAIARDGEPCLPSAAYLEAAIVSRSRDFTRGNLDSLLSSLRFAFIALDEPIARLAADAFTRYGRGTGHPAALNFGDCIAYATAMHLDVPLLFKGDDFRHTDVKAAL